MLIGHIGFQYFKIRLLWNSSAQPAFPLHMLNTARRNHMARASSTASASTDDLAKQIETLKSDVQALTETLGELGKAQGAAAKNAAAEKATALRDAGEDQINRARDTASDLNDQANEFVRTQPATALGIAAGVGFLVGMMSGRK
jgi:ElaB/YqjD/DUF883 family membrane-anchored ribosome-binding protein